MARKRPRSRISRSLLPAAIAGVGGASVGYFTGRTAASATASAVATLATALAKHSALSTASSVIGAALTASSVIVVGALIPATIVWAIRRKDQLDAEKEEDKD